MQTDPTNSTPKTPEPAATTPAADAPALTDLGHDLRFIRTTRRAAGSGTWVIGTLHGHRFEALVFPENAEVAEWEIGGDSRISKLLLRRLPERREVYVWDRGLDLAPADATAAAIVDFLCAGLAEHTYGK
jgi:hypothetical protein